MRIWFTLQCYIFSNHKQGFVFARSSQKYERYDDASALGDVIHKQIHLIIDTPVEDFLHKLSSGGQKVWQKRYFSITADGRHLVYKATKDTVEASHKRVDLRRVRNH